MVAFESGPRFSLGRVVITHAASSVLPPEDLAAAMRRHARGDWGDIDSHDNQVNEFSLQNGDRLFSVYHARDGTKFYIITEWDRSVTTVLLPEDY